MRRLTINGKEYTFEFSIEASLYNECTEATMNMILGLGKAQGEVESVTEPQQAVEAMRNVFSSAANIPQTAMTLFYAGLLEHHRDSVRSVDDAKAVLADYLRESKTNFYDVMTMMLECMGEDHFFALTGLENILNPKEEKKKRRKSGEE